MGNLVSVAGRYLVRKTKRFNVENRAQSFIDQDKIMVAPKHPSTSKLIESITKDPKVREELMRKNTELDENLKQVYVKSLHKPITHDDEKEKQLKSKLPKERRHVPDLKYGHTEPVVVPKGKYSLAQVIDMLSDHLNDPMVHTPQALAEKYSLDVKLVESLILYFRLFKVERSTEESSQRLLAREKMSSFAKVEDFMSKQTVMKIAGAQYNPDEELKKLRDDEGDDVKTRPDVTKSSHVADHKQQNKTAKPNDEGYRYEAEKDGDYKRVGTGKKKSI